MVTRHVVPWGWVGFALAVALSASLAGGASAQALRYGGQPGDQFAYNIEITVDAGERVITYRGIARYTLDAIAGDELRLTYRGGLTESSRIKEPARPSDPRSGPFGPGRHLPSFPDPFARTAFAGKTITTNRITMSSRGLVRVLEGDSQLPYLLGNVSLLPFELLPTDDLAEWTADSSVSIAEVNERHRRFGPLDPFGRNEPQAVQAGREFTRYRVDRQASTPQVAAVDKTYEFTTPKTSDRPALKITGSGVWKFARKPGVPQSLEMQQNFVVVQENAQVTFPIAIKYQLLTKEELAKLDADAQRRQEELARQAAAAQQQAEAPLTAEEKSAALAALASGDFEPMVAALKDLRAKKPREPDADVVAALTALLTNDNKKIQEDASQTLVNWSPEHKRRVELNSKYDRPSPVDSSERPVTADTPLYVGQIVQMKPFGAFWFPAEVLGLLPDGRVVVRRRGFGGREETLERSKLQLAPAELDQPAAVSEALAASAKNGTRTWTDASGQHKIEAVFLGLADGKVQLRRTDGKEIAVPLERLAPADRQLAEQIQQAAAKAVDNPFE